MVSGQHRATGDPGVVTEPGGDDVDPLGGSRHGVIERRLDDDGQHFVLQLFHQPAADNNDLRVEDVDQIRHGNAGVFGRLFDDVLDEFVAALDGLLAC